MKLTFPGAAGTVTGSKYFVEVHEKKILVDAGFSGDTGRPDDLIMYPPEPLTVLRTGLSGFVSLSNLYKASNQPEVKGIWQHLKYSQEKRKEHRKANFEAASVHAFKDNLCRLF